MPDTRMANSPIAKEAPASPDSITEDQATASPSSIATASPGGIIVVKSFEAIAPLRSWCTKAIVGLTLLIVFLVLASVVSLRQDNRGPMAGISRESAVDALTLFEKTGHRRRKSSKVKAEQSLIEQTGFEEAASSKFEAIHIAFPHGIWNPETAEDIGHAHSKFDSVMEDISDDASSTSTTVKAKKSNTTTAKQNISDDANSTNSTVEAEKAKATTAKQGISDDANSTSTSVKANTTTAKQELGALNKSNASVPTTPAPRTGRRGSFLVLGDWGWDEVTHGNVESATCQKSISSVMLQKMQELGDVKFIINVGDSFYPSGVQSQEDEKWDTHWRNRYAAELRSVPWYSTYGNHDYQSDPCACGSVPDDCAQYNKNISDTNWFYWPDFSWFKEHPELGLEVVSLDMNLYMDIWDGNDPPVPNDCQYSPCWDKCTENIAWRTGKAIELFKERSEASTAKNLVVFSHYPTDYLWPSDDLMNGLRRNTTADGHHRHVEYFGGHRHNVDQTSTTSIAPNSNWLVGGGGGWGTDGDSQGFVVGEITDTFDIVTYAVLVDERSGCF